MLIGELGNLYFIGVCRLFLFLVQGFYLRLQFIYFFPVVALEFFYLSVIAFLELLIILGQGV